VWNHLNGVGLDREQRAFDMTVPELQQAIAQDLNEANTLVADSCRPEAGIGASRSKAAFHRTEFSIPVFNLKNWIFGRVRPLCRVNRRPRTAGYWQLNSMISVSPTNQTFAAH
jgi:hypothetical protein